VRAPRVTVVDYGIGNVHSVVKALRHEGAEVTLSADPRDVPAAERLVVPGVGAFADGMKGLRERGMVEPIRAWADTGRPLLGICLGMQVLLGESEEFGREPHNSVAAAQTIRGQRLCPRGLPR